MYIHKISGARISSENYRRLTYSEQQSFIEESNGSSPTHSTRNSSGDMLTSGIIGAVTDNALLGGLLGGSIIGGVLGDVFGDGELF